VPLVVPGRVTVFGGSRKAWETMERRCSETRSMGQLVAQLSAAVTDVASPCPNDDGVFAVGARDRDSHLEAVTSQDVFHSLLTREGQILA
jgi:hypothetical protein